MDYKKHLLISILINMFSPAAFSDVTDWTIHSSAAISDAMDWTFHPPPQCPNKAPNSLPFLTVPAETSLVCAQTCSRTHECASIYFKTDCKMYSTPADKKCSGFGDGVVEGYYEIRRVSTLLYRPSIFLHFRVKKAS